MNSSNEFSNHFKAITLLYTVFLGGQLIFAVAAYYFARELQLNPEGDASIDSIFQYLIPGYAVLSIVGSRFWRVNQFNSIKQLVSLEEKIEKYRQALILNYALLEGAALFALVGYVITQNYVYLGIALIIIAAFMFNKPSPQKAIVDLDLSESEKMKLQL